MPQKFRFDSNTSFAKGLLNLPRSELALVPNDILRIHLMIVKDLRAFGMVGLMIPSHIQMSGGKQNLGTKLDKHLKI